MRPECQIMGARSSVQENEGKKDFGATGGIQNCRTMAATLQEFDIAGTVRERPKLLGTHIQTTRAYTGPAEAESARLQQATKLCHLAITLPITTKEKLHDAKSTAMAKAAAGSWSRLPTLAVWSKFQSSINAIDNTNGHLKPLFRGHTADPVFVIGFRQSQYILTKHHSFAWNTCQQQGPCNLLRTWMKR